MATQDLGNPVNYLCQCIRVLILKKKKYIQKIVDYNVPIFNEKKISSEGSYI